MAVSVKHVGTHNSKKIVVLFRQTPNEDHMALVVYSDSMPSLIHDAVMECVQRSIWSIPAKAFYKRNHTKCQTWCI